MPDPTPPKREHSTVCNKSSEDPVLPPTLPQTLPLTSVPFPQTVDATKGTPKPPNFDIPVLSFSDSETPCVPSSVPDKSSATAQSAALPSNTNTESLPPDSPVRSKENKAGDASVAHLEMMANLVEFKADMKEEIQKVNEKINKIETLMTSFLESLTSHNGGASQMLPRSKSRDELLQPAREDKDLLDGIPDNVKEQLVPPPRRDKEELVLSPTVGHQQGRAKGGNRVHVTKGISNRHKGNRAGRQLSPSDKEKEGIQVPSSNNAVIKKMLEQEIQEQGRDNRQRREEFL